MEMIRVNRVFVLILAAAGFLFSHLPAADLTVDNLEGITDVALVVSINGQQYYSGNRSLRDRTAADFNLGKVETRLKQENLPVEVQGVKGWYSALLRVVGSSRLRLNRFYRGSLTAVPRLMTAIHIKTAGETAPDLYLVSVHLSLSKLAWIRQGPEKNSQVHLWYDWEMSLVDGTALVTEAEQMAVRLMQRFLEAHREANR